MSKFLKLAAMKNGGKVKVQKAVIGSLIGRGARKGVEMLTVSKSAIQKGAKDKLARDKFQEASKNYQRGDTEKLENLKLDSLGLPTSTVLTADKSGGGIYKNLNKILSAVPPTAAKAPSGGVMDKLTKLFLGLKKE